MARGEHEIPGTDSWLTAAEADRARGLRFTKRRTEYRLRRWVCKHAVATAAGHRCDLESLARIEVANRPTGVPYVLLDGTELELAVSLTDRAGWAVCVVTDGPGGLGCDLELVEPRSAGFVADFLTSAEREYVGSLPGSHRDAAANLIWSAKESALKVLGTGLRRDTRSVEVTVGGADEGPGWAPLAVLTAEGTRLPGWWRREGDFVVTVASPRDAPPPTMLLGSADLGSAQPVHSWQHQPLVP
jgi:4'-phosphopantetheinyl transferase